MSEYRKKDYQSLVDGSLALTSFSDQARVEPGNQVRMKTSPQKPHADYQTVGPGLEYYYLGNGLITAVVQHCTVASSGTSYGLFLMHPEHFARKSSTFLYHPESGVERTMVTVAVNEKLYHPTLASFDVRWEYPVGIPTVVAAWRAGRCTVQEDLWCPIGVPALIRTVRVTNQGSAPVDVETQAMLYANPTMFDDQFALQVEGILEARGFLVLQLFSVDDARARDRWVTSSTQRLEKGGQFTTTFVYRLDGSRRRYSKGQIAQFREKSSDYWKSTSELKAKPMLDHLFLTAKNGLHAAISSSGKMDSGIWQYNQEWVRDETMVVVALVLSGQEKLAKTLLQRMMEKMVNQSGVTLESSRWRGFHLYELDQNGELLYAIWMYWRWTNDDSFLKKYWRKIVAVAEFPLRPEFRNEESGLLKNTREYWERSAPYGVREGYELTYQLWPSIGLARAAEMARRMKKESLAERWMLASERIKHSMLSNPRFALIEGGRLIKRRLSNGEVQSVFVPPDRSAMPPGAPLTTDEVCYCEPDTQEALPIALEFVSPDSGLARNTMMELEKLWNQRWEIGGYSRYHVASEPDSPGPWPFPTMFVARAYLEMGDSEKVWRALKWMHEVQGGKAGTWLEHFGDRAVPPLPPTGIVPWAWAELIIFFVHHLLGVRPGEKELVIRPKLLSGLKEVSARVRVHGRVISLRVRRGKKKEARVGGKKSPLVRHTLTIPFPKADVRIEMTV
ncbi:MAG: hypothetical protein WBW16_08535 [Bacteroidota bacterium]